MNTLSSAQLDAFYAVAQLRNFTQAAQRLHVTQSALSQRILNLEQELETALFIRDRAGLRLTEAAQELLRYCQLRGAAETEFLHRIKSPQSKELAGVLRVGGFSSVMRSVVLPSLKSLLQENPRLQLNFHIQELQDLPALLKRGEVDFIFSNEPWDHEEIISVNVGEESCVLVEAKNYQGPDIFIDHDEDDQTTVQYLKLNKKKTVALQKRYLDDVYGILDGVKLGLGRGVLPLHLIRDAKDLRIVKGEKALKVPVYLHYYRQAYYPQVHKAALACFEKNMGPLLAVGGLS